MLGAFVQGIQVEGRSYAGGWFDWLTPFSLLTGARAGRWATPCSAPAGSIMKTEGELQARAYRLMQPLAGRGAGAIAAVSLWTPFLNDAIAERWFSWPNIAILSPVPILVAVVALALFRALARGYEVQPFLLALALFVLVLRGSRHQPLPAHHPADGRPSGRPRRRRRA